MPEQQGSKEFIEFFHQKHFNDDYKRALIELPLMPYVQSIWESDFEHLWKRLPSGFSTSLFPSVGYTYLFNLGSEFLITQGRQQYLCKWHTFIPAGKPTTFHFTPGNKIFAIRFYATPDMLERPIDFSAYTTGIGPLSYFASSELTSSIMEASNFEERAKVVGNYYTKVLQKSAGKIHKIFIVGDALVRAQLSTKITIRQLARTYALSPRTLLRYFESVCCGGPKEVVLMLRIRRAIHDIISSHELSSYSRNGYYSQRHFTWHLKHFLGSEFANFMQQLLSAADST